MILIPVPLVNDTVWSGAVFVIQIVPAVVNGTPDTLIPVPELAFTHVTVPVQLVYPEGLDKE